MVAVGGIRNRGNFYDNDNSRKKKGERERERKRMKRVFDNFFARIQGCSNECQQKQEAKKKKKKKKGKKRKETLSRMNSGVSRRSVLRGDDCPDRSFNIYYQQCPTVLSYSDHAFRSFRKRALFLLSSWSIFPYVNNG